MIGRFEISDRDWDRIKDLLPGKTGYAGPVTENRLFVNAVIHVAKTGVAWRDLPERFGKWNTVYVRFRRWAQKGVWQRVFAALSDPELKTLMIDSTALRVHQHGAGALKKTVAKANRRSAAAGAG